MCLAISGVWRFHFVTKKPSVSRHRCWLLCMYVEFVVVDVWIEFQYTVCALGLKFVRYNKSKFFFFTRTGRSLIRSSLIKTCNTSFFSAFRHLQKLLAFRSSERWQSIFYYRWSVVASLSPRSMLKQNISRNRNNATAYQSGNKLIMERKVHRAFMPVSCCCSTSSRTAGRCTRKAMQMTRSCIGD